MAIYETTAIRFIKFSLILFSVVLVFTGISLIIIGTTINSIYEEFSNFLENICFSPAKLLINIGFVIFGIACLGCFGAIKEYTNIIITFGILLGASSVMQFGAGVSNNIIMARIDKVLVHSLNNSMLSYETNVKSQAIVDNLQQELHCCGFSGPRDWKAIFGTNSIPESCCAVVDRGECRATFNNGCHIILRGIITESSKILTVSAYLLAFTQVLGMFFAFYLANVLRSQKRTRDYRRWAIRNELLSSWADDPYSFTDSKKPIVNSGKEN